MKYNPFKPGQIINPGMFAGRANEIKAIERILFQTQQGNPDHFLIHGERGIGKSSLLLFIDYMAQGMLSLSNGVTFNFITVNVELEINTDMTGLIQKISIELRDQLKTHDESRSVVKEVLKFLSRFEAAGIKFDRSSDPVSRDELLSNLVSLLKSTYDRLSGEFDGIIILIDEADKSSKNTHIGEFVKIFTERLTKKKCSTILLGMSGISTVIGALRRSHESSVRILKQFELKTLPIEEAKDVVKRGLEEAKRRNSKETTIADNALEWLAGRGSEGYPNFIQEYAFHAFEADTDDKITMIDLQVGVHLENGALDQLGAKYFEKMYLNDIRSDDYRKVLRTMADHPGEYVTKQELRDESGLSGYKLNNALRSLKQRHIIIPKKGKQGVYRLPSRSFAVWIKAHAAKSEESEVE